MIKIEFDKENNKSVAHDEKVKIGECDFIESEGIWNIVHTEVSNLYQGQGIARRLVEAIIEEAKKCNKSLIADCSYARKVIERGAFIKKEEVNNYDIEAKEKWGHTNQYEEFKQKNKSQQELEIAKNQLMELFVQLGELKQLPPESEVVQKKIKELQEFITKNYYSCTNEVLKGLGQMYINDERFRKNIDEAGGEGTAAFVQKAIFLYCSK